MSVVFQMVAKLRPKIENPTAGPISDSKYSMKVSASNGNNAEKYDKTNISSI